MRWMLWLLTLTITAALIGCGDDTPKSTSKTTGTPPEALPTGPASTGPSKNTIRIMLAGLNDRTAAAVAAGAKQYFVEQKRDWAIVIQPQLPAFSDDDAVSAIIVFADAANAPKLAPKAKYTPVVVLEPQTTSPVSMFTVKTNTGGGAALLTTGLTKELVEKIRSGGGESVSIPDYFELGHRAAQIAHNAIKGEGDLKGLPVTANETVSPLLLNKAMLDDPKVKPLLP